MRKIIGALILTLLLVGSAFFYHRRFAVPMQTIPARTLHVIGIADLARFSPDGKILAIVTEPDTMPQSRTDSIEIWDTATWQRQRILPDAKFFMYFSPNGKTLFCAEDTVEEWDIATGRLVHRYENIGYVVTFSQDRRFFATSKVIVKKQNLLASEVTVWDTISRKPVAVIRLPNVLVTWDDAVFSPDDSLLTIDSGDLGKKLTLWKTKTGTEITSLGSSAEGIKQSAFSPDGKVLAMTGVGLPLTFWDTSTWKEIRSCPMNLKLVDDISFSSTGKRMFVMGEEAPGPSRFGVTLRDAASGKVIEQLPGQFQLAFSHDGTLLATDGKTVSIWDATTGNKVAEYGHQQPSLMFPTVSPNNQILVTTESRTGNVDIWNIPGPLR